MAHFSSHPLRASRHRARWHVLALLLALLGLALPQASQAQAPKAGAAPSFFQVDGTAAARGSAGAAAGMALRLDTTALRAVLRQVPPVGASAQSGVGTGVLMALPMPDGSTGQFRIYETSMMAPALAAQFPSIKTYMGTGVDDPTATISLDLTPLGFHAMVLSAQSGTSYIDPVGEASSLRYRSIFRKDKSLSGFSCGAPAGPGLGSKARTAAPSTSTQRTTLATYAKFRTYRLALACTPEYASKFVGTANTPETKETNVFSAMVTSLSRVNGIYATELGIWMELVSENRKLVFVDNPKYKYPTIINGVAGAFLRNYVTQPTFITDANGSVIKQISAEAQNLSVNQYNTDLLIGTANYDIGHLFCVGNGGLAMLASVGSSIAKAKGVTGAYCTPQNFGHKNGKARPL